MKKICVFLIVILGFLLMSQGCIGKFPLPAAPAPPATPTATPIPTPICGIAAAIPLAGFGPSWAGYSQTNPPTSAPFCVIRNAADWQAFWGTSTPPAPPVDFALQMLVIVVNYGICPMRNASITDVCEDSSQVAVAVKDPDHSSYDALCAGPFAVYTAMAVAVNSSNLPVVWTVSTAP